jgi:hypothetical protein
MAPFRQAFGRILMEETTGTTTAPNRTVIILLAVIVVLLLGIVAYFLFFANGSGSDTVTTDTGAADTGTTGMTGTTTPAEFDPAVATQVPAGETPEQYVSAYFEAVVAGDFQTAYDRLPADKKAAQDVTSFGEQLKGYGVTAFTIDNVAEEGDEAQVTATATMPGGAFAYLWTFVKDGDGWLVKSRTLPGMGN